MDRYQKALLERIVIKGQDASGRTLPADPGEGAAGRHASAACALRDGRIEFRQSGDINETRYRLTVSGYPVEALWAVKGGEMTPVTAKRLPSADGADGTDAPPRMAAGEEYSVDIDFEDRTDALEIRFIRSLADDLTLPIMYAEADRERYYAEEKAATERAYLSRADVRHTTGASLVNITFRHCCSEYAYSVVRIFSGGPGPRGLRALFGGKRDAAEEDVEGWKEIRSFRLEGDDTFLAVDSLADGRYAYELTQYDGRDDHLVATGRVRFDITSGRGVVIFGR